MHIPDIQRRNQCPATSAAVNELLGVGDMLFYAPPMDSTAPPPRYLRFLRSLVVTGAVASTPLVSACEDAKKPCAEGACDAGPVLVDGPLPPPDLPVAIA